MDNADTTAAHIPQRDNDIDPQTGLSRDRKLVTFESMRRRPSLLARLRRRLGRTPPSPPSSSSTPAPTSAEEPAVSALDALVAMGFSREAAADALAGSDDNLERAIDRLLTAAADQPPSYETIVAAGHADTPWAQHPTDRRGGAPPVPLAPAEDTSRDEQLARQLQEADWHAALHRLPAEDTSGDEQLALRLQTQLESEASVERPIHVQCWHCRRIMSAPLGYRPGRSPPLECPFCQAHVTTRATAPS